MSQAMELLMLLTIIGLLAACLVLLTGRTARIRRLVAKRTHELSQSEQRFRRLVENAGDAFFLHDMQGRFLDVNRRACESLGYTREELLSMGVADVELMFFKDHWKHDPQEYPISFEGLHRRKDGTTFPVEIRLARLDAGDQPLMLALVRDITERKQAEQSLREDQRLLRELLELHERDRKLVAYEIHDGLAQQLAAAQYRFQAVAPLRQRDPEAADEMFDEAMRLLGEAMVETRRLIGGLRPPVLDELGIVAAVECLVVEGRQNGGPEIEFVHETPLDRMAAPLEGAIFRIIQECLTNACRHSQSQRVRVELAQSNGRVRIDVQDWGVGFNPTEVSDNHFGLRGIRERAKLLGGHASIEAAPGQGVRVKVDLPSIAPAESPEAPPAPVPQCKSWLSKHKLPG